MKIKPTYKVFSGALQLTVFIGIIIALILAGIVLLAYTHGFFTAQSKAVVQNIQNASSGMHALLLQESINNPNDTIKMPLPENDDDNYLVKIHLSYWGIFEKAIATAKHRNKTFIKCSLLGTGLNTDSRPALYLQETFKPLALAGNTKITGKAILPEQGVRPGNILGNSYYGSELIYGNTQKSSKNLPELKHYYKKQLEYYLKEYVPQNSRDFILIPGYKITNSFKATTQGYYSQTDIVLDKVSIYGNIIIKSAKSITVKKQADLRDIILIAPKIIIEDNVNSNFQAIAEKSVKAGKNCSLNYPSALIIAENNEDDFEDDEDSYSNQIFIDKGTIVKGSLCYFHNKADLGYTANIYVNENVFIYGEIYCQGNLELKGNVNGTVYTSQFIANEGGTVYINHIYNGNINSAGLPENFGGILFNTQTKKVVKWLY